MRLSIFIYFYPLLSIYIYFYLPLLATNWFYTVHVLQVFFRIMSFTKRNKKRKGTKRPRERSSSSTSSTISEYEDSKEIIEKFKRWLKNKRQKKRDGKGEVYFADDSISEQNSEEVRPVKKQKRKKTKFPPMVGRFIATIDFQEVSITRNYSFCNFVFYDNFVCLCMKPEGHCAE